MTRVDLEAAELMLDEATPGPWHANRHGEVCFTLPSGLSFAIADVYGDAGPDRDLIVAAPTLIRSLIEEIERLRMLVAELMDSNDMACETPASACDCSGCSYAREESERV